MYTDFSKIDKSMIDKQIEVGGFVNSIRDHGGLIFIDLRSETEILQCVIDPQDNSQIFEVAEHLSSESVLKIQGKIKLRDPELINPKITTGEIELRINQMQVVCRAKTLPFDLNAEETKMAGEEIRLKYRYLDLRRSKIKDMLYRKHRLFLDVRNWFDKQGFLEVQTPILANSSPEGARDYLIPSRLHPGKFYALPQAPQQFKQLLMVGGFNKYFQIAPCFRDEDPRADRHPGDFYQVDAEIAWASQEDIFEITSKLIREVLVKHTHKKLIQEDPFVRLTYQEAMEKYGSDKPDVRNELVWTSAREIFMDSGFKVFADLAKNQNSGLKALVVRDAVDKMSRKDLDQIQNLGRSFNLPGIAYIQYTQNEVKSPIFKFFGSQKEIDKGKQKIQKFLSTQTGDLVFFVGHTDKSLVYKVQNALRKHLATKLNLIDQDTLRMAWIYDFPFFEKNEDTGKFDFGHNPFSMWQAFEGKTKLETLIEARQNNQLDKIKAMQYDWAVNGYEVLSGGVRNPYPECIKEAFCTVGYSQEEVQAKFGHMVEAYTYGAPEHAGFAWGLDRLFMVLVGEENIRETIAFPKNGSGVDLMVNSPAEVNPENLKELKIKTL